MFCIAVDSHGEMTKTWNYSKFKVSYQSTRFPWGYVRNSSSCTSKLFFQGHSFFGSSFLLVHLLLSTMATTMAPSASTTTTTTRSNGSTLKWIACISFALSIYSNIILMRQLRSATAALPTTSSVGTTPRSTETTAISPPAIVNLNPQTRQIGTGEEKTAATVRLIDFENVVTARAAAAAHSVPSSSTPIWEHSRVLPQWMKDYFTWHKEQTTHHLNETNWKSHRYLVARCLKYEKCGGASDRLQSVPMLIRVASMTNRLLLIKWTRPAPLEEYLVPPINGINWTVPAWLDQSWQLERGPILREYPGLATSLGYRIVATRDQTHDHGMNFYNKHLRVEDNEAHFGLVFRDVWNVLFTPAPPVASRIEQNLKRMHLVPGQYVAVHVRSKYKDDQSNNLDLIRNSINCASTLRKEQQLNGQQSSSSSWPMYMASDSSTATKNALRYVLSKNDSSLVFRNDDNSTDDPLCLDKADRKGYQFDKPELFYDLFVDLYLLANSACLTHGIGKVM
jgi:hypothetical protein